MRLYKKWMQVGMTVKAGRYPVATIISTDLIRCATTGNLWVNGFTVKLEGDSEPIKFVDGAISQPITSLSYERDTYNKIMLTSKRSVKVKFITSFHFRTLKLNYVLSEGFSLSGKIAGHSVCFWFDKPENLSIFPYMTLDDIDDNISQNAEIHNVSKAIKPRTFENFTMNKIDLND